MLIRRGNWIYRTLIIASLIMLSLASLVNIYLELPVSSTIAALSFLVLCSGMLPSFGLRELTLALISVLLAIGLIVRDNEIGNVRIALDRAAFFAAFIYLVTLLKEAASRSASVVKLGAFLTRQTANRRYYALAFGGHAMGVVLNFGAISLITPLIQRGVAQLSNTKQQSALERQQLSALIRGFSWMIMWSPTALTQAVLFTSFPGADVTKAMALGIIASVVMILVGRLEDRWQAPIPDLQIGLELPVRAAVRFTIVCTVLIASAWLTTQIASVSAAMALMLVAPLLMFAWIFSQRFSINQHGAFRASVQDLFNIIGNSSTVLGKSAFTLGAAGFIGEAAARLAPVGLIANGMQDLNIPDWAFLMSLPIIITVCGQIALSPILVVVFLSSVINQLPTLPADPTLIVFALGAGWALSMSASPNASATLLISGITGISPTTLTWRWNGRYALMCAALFFLSFYILTQWVVLS